jgi:hypothetical protein
MNWLRSEDLKEEKVITTPRHYNTPERGVLAPNRPRGRFTPVTSWGLWAKG